MKSLTIDKSWEEIFDREDSLLAKFESEIVPSYVLNMRWFGAKTSHIKRYNIDRIFPYEISKNQKAFFLFVEAVFETAHSETYLLPVCMNTEAEDKKAIICQLKNAKGEKTGYLIDAIYCKKFRESIFQHILDRSKLEVPGGELTFSKGKRLKPAAAIHGKNSKVLAVEQSNSTIVYGDLYYLKIYRKLFRNNNPDLELTRFLSEKSNFPHSPHFAGSIEWIRADYYTVSLGLMQEKVDNEGEAWNDTLNEIEAFFKRSNELDLKLDDLPKVELYRAIELRKVPAFYRKLVGEGMLAKVKKLAVRTAELHLSLAEDKTDRHFNPEAFTSDYTVWLLNRVMYMYDRRFHLLDQHKKELKGKAREYADYLIDNKDRIKDRLLNFDEQKLNSARIRIHGDYHLGQVLITGDDFCILDFEGEPESTIRDRKVKQPPVKDLAGLFRSYHYAVFATIFQRFAGHPDQEMLMEIGGRYYRLLVGISLYYYTKTAMEGGLNIGYEREIDFLLRYHIFEKAIYELGYELHARPDWVVIPLKGIMQILNND